MANNNQEPNNQNPNENSSEKNEAAPQNNVEAPKKQEKVAPVKRYYTVKMETLTPVIFSYRILAESPEEAIKISADTWKQPSQVSPPQILSGKMKRLKATVYEYGTNLIKLFKNF